MKKIIFTLMFSAIAFTGFSQVVDMKGTASNPTNTIANTAVDSLSLQKALNYDKLSFHFIVTRNSGTLGGTSILYKSNYVNGPWQGVDTLTLSNVAVVDKYVDVTSPTAQYWFYKTTGSGTMNATIKCGVTGIRH